MGVYSYNHSDYRCIGNQLGTPGLPWTPANRKTTRMIKEATYASSLRKPPRSVSPGSFGSMIVSFKSAVTRSIGREMNETGIWQHIIKNTSSVTQPICKTKADYTIANPPLWDEEMRNQLT